MPKSLILAAVIAANAASAARSEPTVTDFMIPPIALGTVSFVGGKTMSFDIGVGSGATHGADQASDLFYTLSDRGPNIKCKDAQKTLGQSTEALCAGEKSSKIFPMPTYAPRILEYRLNSDGLSLVRQLPLKGTSGGPITGLTNPLTVTNTESSFDPMGQRLAFDASGLDTEALAVAGDGSFWIGEEYGASIVHVGGDGTILTRYVPKGEEEDLAAADYPVVGALPALVAKRKLNRGIEAVALSRDGRSLYFSMQSPLSNPDDKAYAQGRYLRIYKFDIAAEKTVSEWLYPMDAAESFAADNATKPRKPKDVKLSEMAMLEDGQLLVLERISKTTRLYRINPDVTGKVAAKFDLAATMPALEGLDGQALNAAAVDLLKKVLVLDTDNLKGKPVKKLEGIAVMSDRQIVLVNDNDFGLGGASFARVVTFAQPISRTKAGGS